MLTAAALLVHGYHLGVDDAEIYMPAVKHLYDPALYPMGREFFLAHEHLSLFAPVVAGIGRLLHLAPDAAIFLVWILSTFAFLLALQRIASVCFEGAAARLAAVATLAALLAAPAAGTALALLDPYLTARSLSTPLSLFTVNAALRGRWRRALLWLALTAAVHPQMAVYAAGLLLLIHAAAWAAARNQHRAGPLGGVLHLPNGFTLGQVPEPYRSVLHSRTFYFLGHWSWYEWFGGIAPLLLLAVFARAPLRGVTPRLRTLAMALAIFGAVSWVFGLAFSFAPALETFARLQPMRSFHLIYILFFLMLGGLVGEYLLKRVWWRWVLVFAPLCAGMLLFALASYPHSRHVEWPWLQPRNLYVRAFLWVRNNTPKDAVFALDPETMAIPADDRHGFRAIAERSMLADAVKDSGAVSLFPALVQDWQAQQAAQAGWRSFQLHDFLRLQRTYGVGWVLLDRVPPPGLACPYQQDGLAVCQLPQLPQILNR